MEKEFIIKLRQKTKLSQNMFGHIFCVTGSLVTLWEKGLRNPDMYKQMSMILLDKKLDKDINHDLEKMLLLFGPAKVLEYTFTL
jgi:DNA-binding transcriptional regulator YiaG